MKAPLRVPSESDAFEPSEAREAESREEVEVLRHLLRRDRHSLCGLLLVAEKTAAYATA